MTSPIDSALTDESWKAPRRLDNALRLLRGELQPRLGPTPGVEIGRWGRVSLSAHEAEAPVYRSPILLVPSPLDPPFVFDLTEGASLVEFLTKKGIPVYVLDWGRPTPADAHATLEDHARRWLGAALRRSARHAGVPAVHLMGHGLGATLAALAAALRPALVAGLVALDARLSFADHALLEAWTSGGDDEGVAVAEALGLVPRDWVEPALSRLSAAERSRSLHGLADRLWDELACARYLALAAALDAGGALPSALFVGLLRELDGPDGGAAATVSRLEMPLLDVTTRPVEGATLASMTGSSDVTSLALPGPSVDALAGPGARDGLWRSLRNWLVARPVGEARA